MGHPVLEEDIQATIVTPPPQRAVRRRFPVTEYALKRIGAGILTMIAASILIFLIIRVLPGSTAELVLGKNATPQRIAEINTQLHTDRPLWENYLDFVRGMLTGDLGVSTASLAQGDHVSIASTLKNDAGNTLTLALVTLVLLVPLTTALGLFSGLKPNSPRDHGISLVSLVIGAMPEFLLGTFLVLIFFTKFDLLPPISSIPKGHSPWADPKLLVLPVVTLLLVCAAFGARILRSSVADTLNQDFVNVARINGARRTELIRRYILPNSLIPFVQVTGQQLQYLVGGLIVVESVFDFPGIGQDLVQAVQIHDTQMIMVLSMLLAAFYIAVNVITDVVCILLDPRVRTSL